MQTAKGTVVLAPENKQFKYGITPAEALILFKLHFKHANGTPLEDLVLDGEATETVQGKKPPRTNAEECARLKRKYTGIVDGKRAFEAVFGSGSIVQLPKTFEEIAETIGLQVAEASTPTAADPNAVNEVHTHEWNAELEAELIKLQTTHKPVKDQKDRLAELKDYKATATNVRR